MPFIGQQLSQSARALCADYPGAVCYTVSGTLLICSLLFICFVVWLEMHSRKVERAYAKGEADGKAHKPAAPDAYRSMELQHAYKCGFAMGAFLRNAR
jgi:hypothetical protein